jgi:hypothetical protein
MWYVMGIGDAILWRDRSQEAADAVAYTSAAVHARGMNFISAMNIVMLIITALYIVMCIARSVIDIVLYITGDPWQSKCWPGLWPPSNLKDTTGHGIISFAGGLPPMNFLSGFGAVPPGQLTQACGVRSPTSTRGRPAPACATTCSTAACAVRASRAWSTSSCRSPRSPPRASAW